MQVLALQGGGGPRVVRDQLPAEPAHHLRPGRRPLPRQAGRAQLDAVVEPPPAAHPHLETAGGDEVPLAAAEGAGAVGVGVEEEEMG